MTVWLAGMVTLVGGLLTGMIAWWIASRGAVPQAAEQVTPRVSRARLRYLLALSAVLLLALIVTLPRLPYPRFAADEPGLKLKAVGRMWAWQIESAEGTPQVRRSDGRIVVPVGRAVAFEVTAEDVNHGFGVYDEQGRLLGQTQAMPGYTNRLTVVFPKPGRYHVLCMEYCGIGHHLMNATLEAE